ncbi:MAG: HDIG domain-containing protein [Desulfuromonadales bacterium]|nr:HDIG domain-containing protein [Desulfuromonadales bacterium]
MNPWLLLDKYYPPADPAREILFAHSRAVAAKALAVARRLAPCESVDLSFVEEAALLHDIGIRFVQAPAIGCHGDLPYLAHGYKGRELLEAEGWPHHALVCERHIGVGLSAATIRAQHLPLPLRDMIPETREETIIAYADLFFSKGESELTVEKSLARVRQGVARFGAENLAIFERWHALFAA